MSDLSTWKTRFFFLGALLHYSIMNHEVSASLPCPALGRSYSMEHWWGERGKSIYPVNGATALPRSYELSFPTTADSYWLNRVEADGGYGWFCQLQEEYTVENLGFIDQLCNWGWHNLVAFLWSQSINHTFILASTVVTAPYQARGKLNHWTVGHGSPRGLSYNVLEKGKTVRCLSIINISIFPN